MTATSPRNVILQIKDLVKVFHSKTKTVHALNGINLDIYQGEIMALLGVNGAGKTTLSSILVTLNPPTSGDVLFKGQSIYQNLAQYRHALGFCPQRPNLDYELTVEENLFFAGRYYLVPEDILRERVSSLLQQFELVKYASFNVRALSGGYKQRLLIARALVHSPEIVIMDEPTVALDPNIRRQLWDKIKELKQLGITVILTTHYLEEAEILSDRVCMLNAGSVLLIDQAENLKQKFNMPNLEEVFLHLTNEEAA
ncbi:ABC transporter ATP-binding protein [bacterium]|nr:ABC transporter ATP-binding protein [bacterium]